MARGASGRVHCRRAGTPDCVAELSGAGGTDRTYELFDAADDRAVARALLHHAASASRVRGSSGAIDTVVWDRRDIRRAMGDDAAALERSRRGSNALVAIGKRVVVKLFRQIEPGPNPELEMRTRLREVGFTHTPEVVAAFRWEGPDGRRRTVAWIGLAQQFVDNEGEAWSHAVAAARRYLRRVLSLRRAPPDVQSIVPFADRMHGDPGVDAAIGRYCDEVERLAHRVAELHVALATPTSDPAFAPEPFSVFSRRSAYQRMRASALMLLDVLHTRAASGISDVQPLAARVLERGEEILAASRSVLECRTTAPRIRCHGNLHLGQILRTDGDLIVIDFDGEPGRPLYERRLKRTPLHDVATIVRSFHYAAHAALARRGGRTASQGDAMKWMRAWQLQVGALFVDAYTRAVARSALVPSAANEMRLLLRLLMLERGVYECRFELDRRSPWAAAPLSDLPMLLDAGRTQPS